MRARYKPWAADLIEAHPEIVIPNPEALKGKWHEEFGNDHPIHIEAGSGKGRFITGMAQANPDINYIGIELFESVIVTALQGALEPEGGIPNLRLLQVNAQELETFFEAGEIDRVYLNFSDPWPKTRHAKRRLTHESFLKLYERVLPEGGEIHFKTDNRGLFEYSLTSISEYGMLLKDVSLDLHANEPEWNIMTEYEEKFLKKGQPIYRLEAKFQA
ncbi:MULTISPECIES: tRNA (guanosine(46)-N7)-methyltransferase TrmB [unclassified Planococcus (in: firmicutes)]|uniref:tRNA (guanosine(46)-N7)-methyltransferase TrmB n=1 Tax=unclassified Planococcus (in: firmicutes) TaxID=2662419 RepID=UPI000C34421C|nr:MULTISPECIES: tRNA (guanosine(46)-N7)-methyltransferase TrmB [unclassified Planococcus (in: firmicutes)]AUD13565.1 tRNA (guanosine(46)-N7)-methyltransferase TrmB [Planococcus sp. MB-3u-03]PKG46448.1 tRNA (guanosine(46)-N7)-methyltransferase TrmB [Planococcus sp. Urea-trap-24]PKG89384.1 tRNA (guanosine(46)-N7)-methyltransferase TrmB [Planococcus sp. Urea-3u-39]PKH41191.1 tRNA (guanosine(46)-N7)-methyltransferase TrmB [Planococcus sp. MB-3u-09]